MLGSLRPVELIVIVAVAILLFGGKRIADIGKGLGQGIRNFKSGLKEGDEAGVDDDAAANKPSSEKSGDTPRS